MTKKREQQITRPEPVDPMAWDGIIILHGHKIRCLAAADVLAADPPRPAPEPPTYTFTDAAGEEVTVPYDEKAIQDDKATLEDKLAWLQYQEDLAAWQVEAGELQVKRTLLRAVELVDPNDGPNDDWEEEQRFLGLDVPDGRAARKYAFLRSEVVRTPQDIAEVYKGILKVSGADQEVLDALEARFRSSLADLWGAYSAANQDDAGAGTVEDGA